MRKILLIALLLVQLAATAFAHTGSSFKAYSNVPGARVEAVGQFFYAIIDEENDDACFAEELNAQKADEFLGAPFSTAAFEKTYNDILLLKRNRISQPQINKLVSSAFTSGVFSFVGEKEPEHMIGAEKIGRNKFITVSFKDETLNKPVTLYYTSANDRLYLLIVQRELFGTAAETEEVTGIIGGADGPTAIWIAEDGNAEAEPVEAQPPAKSALADKFLKKFKAVVPKQPAPLAFADGLTGFAAKLPEGWGYWQLNDSYNGERACLTLALPEEAMLKVAREAFKLGVNNLGSAVDKAAAGNAEPEESFIEAFKHGLIIGTFTLKNDNYLQKIFAAPNSTALEVEQGIEHLKDYLAGHTQIKAFDSSVNFNSDFGSVRITTELVPNGTDYGYQLQLLGSLDKKIAFFSFSFNRSDEDTALPEVNNGKDLGQ